MSVDGDDQRWWNIQLAAREVRCCRAGRVGFPEPCTWHGRSDPQYLLINQNGTWFA